MEHLGQTGTATTATTTRIMVQTSEARISKVRISKVRINRETINRAPPMSNKEPQTKISLHQPPMFESKAAANRRLDRSEESEIQETTFSVTIVPSD